MSQRVSAAIGGFVLLSCGIAALGQTTASDEADQAKLGIITVTGSALPRTDKETPSPVIVIDAIDIKRSGLTTVADVVRAISADNSGTIPTAFTAGFAAGSSGVALRGLTVNSTLVLIDGRRVASYALADDGQRSFVDLNTIPLGAVERIEVLKDGASSLYGADAIAGVVNIILYHDFRGLDANVEFGNSQHGGGFEKRANGAFGSGDLNTDRYNAYVAFEYQGDNHITALSRDFPFDSADLSSIGGFNGLAGQPDIFPFGSTIGSVTPATLGTPGDLTSGVPIDGALAQPLRPCTSNSTLVNDPNNDLGGGAGSYCTENFARYLEHQPAEERIGLYARFTVKINDYSEAYLNANYYRNRVSVGGSPSQIQNSTPNNTDSIALPPTLPDGSLNPNDPFASQGQYALINYAFGDIPGGSEYVNHVARAVAGLRGTWGDWNYDSAVVVNHTWLDSALFGFINYNQLIADVTNGTYNFVDPSQNSPAVRAALSQTLSKTSTSDMDSIDLRVNRSLMELRGGALGLALGAEVRHEAQNDPDLNPNTLYQGLGIAHTIGSRNVSAIYAELDAPLWQSFEINASARYDHYNDFGGAFDPKIGFKWKPIDEVALRGTFSRGFRAPSFAENGSSAAEGFTTYQISDASFISAHGGDSYATAPYALAFSSVANPNIGPERASSATFGGIFEPLTWFNASIDYYAIKKTGVIVQSDPSVALADYFAGTPLPAGFAVLVDVPDPAFPSALPRPVVVQSPYVNANSLRTEGVDVDLRAKFDVWNDARFVSDLTATKIFSWTMHFPDGSSQQYVGTQGPYILSSGAGTPRYRASWTNTLTWGAFETTATIYYVSGLFMSAPDIAPGCFSTDPNGNNFPPSCRVPSFTYADLTGTWHYNDHLDFSAAVENVFDRRAPFDPIDYAGINYNPTYAQAGIIGRFFKVGLHVRF
jgi:iron complex outermembrane receptor protein